MGEHLADGSFSDGRFEVVFSADRIEEIDHMKGRHIATASQGRACFGAPAFTLPDQAA